MRAPITSRKHYVQHTITTVASATVDTNSEIFAVPLQDADAPNEVPEGSVIKAIFLEYWLIGTFNEGSFVLMVEKSQSNLGQPTFTEMTTLDAYENKKNVLFVSQGLISEDGANPTPVLRQWIKIPKGKQRFGVRDAIRVSIAAIGTDAVMYCGFATYKAYT